MVKKKTITIVICTIINIIYSILGTLLFIIYDLTLPGSEKFVIDTCASVILLILLILHFIGELVYYVISYKKLFKERKVSFIIFVIINVNIYFVLTWISTINCILM